MVLVLHHGSCFIIHLLKINIFSPEIKISIPEHCEEVQNRLTKQASK